MYDSTTNAGNITDSQGNTWNALTQYTEGGNGWSTYLFWVIAGTSAANTVTFTLTSGISGGFGIKLYEVNDAAAGTWGLDGTPTGTTSGFNTNPDVGSVTTTATSSFAVANLVKAQACTAGSGWTLGHSTTINGTVGTTEHQITSGSGTINGAFVNATSSGFGGGVAAWKATVGGPGPSTFSKPLWPMSYF
jgi:hypothetical protein